MGTLIAIIIALIIAGFILWAGRQLIAVIPMEPIIAQVANIVIMILAVGVIIFYVVIPLLNMLAGVHLPTPVFR